MKALSVMSLGGPGHVTAIFQPENRKKIDKFKPVYLGKYQYRRKKVCVFEHTINHLSFGDVHLPQVGYYFSFHTFFSSKAIYF